MQLGAVAFVLTEAVFGKTRAEFTHHRVARDFGNHTRRRDGEAETVAINDRSLRQGEWKDGQAVDQDVIWCRSEGSDRYSHRLVGRAKNIDAIDFRCIDNANGPADSLVRDQFLINLLSPFGEELLGIVQAAVTEFSEQNDRSGHDRSGKCAASSLIETRDAGNAERPESSFVSKTAAAHEGEAYPQIAQIFTDFSEETARMHLAFVRTCHPESRRRRRISRLAGNVSAPLLSDSTHFDPC